MTFADLCAVAAVGTGQRSTVPSVGALAAYVPAMGDDEQALAYSLLDSAAAAAVVRKGSLPSVEGAVPSSAPPDPRPVVPDQVQSALGQLLASEGGMIRRHDDRAAVLTESLAMVAEAGLRLPHALIPPALARQDLRAVVRPVLAARGEWLLAQLVAAGRESATETADDVWDTGTSEQRVAWFAAQRAADPDAARALAEAVWKESSAAFRTDLLRAIVATVVPSDEPFLEQCLDDRAEGVRTGAREGLARLPGSAYVARMVARARTAVAVTEGHASAIGRLLRKDARSLVLTPPAADDAATRDGITPRLSSAEALTMLIAAVPPQLWPSIVGVGVAELATLPQDEPRWDLRAGLITATVRHRDRIAATALVGAGVVDVRLVPYVSAETLAEIVRTVPTDQVATVLASVRGPWHPDVATQVGSRLLSATSHQLGPEVWTMFARHVPARLAPSWAQRLRSAGEPEGGRARTIWRDALSVLTVRAVIAEALRPFLTHDGGRP